MTRSLTRRAFVIGAGVAGASLPIRAWGATGATGTTDPVLLLDPRLSRRWPDAQILRTPILRTPILLADPLRQWRAGVGADVARRGGYALVHWDLALMLRQLGREDRVPVRVLPYAAGVFCVTLAPVPVIAARPCATAVSAA